MRFDISLPHIVQTFSFFAIGENQVLLYVAARMNVLTVHAHGSSSQAASQQCYMGD